MNRNRTRKPNAKTQRGLHKINTDTAFGYSALLFSEPATATKVYRKESQR